MNCFHPGRLRRLTFLHKLKEMELEFTQIGLVFLNFWGDETYIPTSLDEWKNHMKAVFTDE